MSKAMLKRFWLFQDRVLTSKELKRTGVSPLRAVDLGRCRSIAIARAHASACLDKAAVLIVARNVRVACDQRRGARWGLSAEEIDQLRSGENLEIVDALGTFRVGYTRAE